MKIRNFCSKRVVPVFVSALTGLVIVSLPQTSEAVQDNRSMAVDKRIRTFVYDPNEVFSFTGHYRFQSSIEFSPDEEIKSVSMGDSTAWQVVPGGSRLFLKPIEQNATTNMTVITSKRIYHFELYAEEANDIRDEKLIFAVRFTYPDSQGATAALRNFEGTDPLPNIEAEPEKFNFNYALKGPEHISPIKIFDDGEFTYFEFQDKNAAIPAFFEVDSEDKEAIVNYRINHPYVIVERVTDRFTLRYGKDVICVYNEARKKVQ